MTPHEPPRGELLLDVHDLRVAIPSDAGDVMAADGVSLQLRQGEVLGVVGETGSGKSVTCRALLGLRPTPQSTVSGTVGYPAHDVDDILSLPPRRLRELWGRRVAMIPQNPMTSLNPVRRIGEQVAEAVGASGGPTGQAGDARVLELLHQVGLPAPETRLRDYPHQFSGGMLQRTVIAIALAQKPDLIVADEPTTALDVLIQDQILALLLSLQRDLGTGLILVSHDLSVVSQVCDRVAVMYAGQIVELADTATLLESPRHPYTRALLGALPGAVPRDQELRVIPGSPPQLVGLGPTCRFAPRCELHEPACDGWPTALRDVGPAHTSRCRRATADNLPSPSPRHQETQS
ncbi:ABC transporter ATP-binding protein [Phycicoccus duodecadis]|jgi:oligopeptide/dipeptide ABC transporter ATP-binding protein|uniref:Peptide/nickel transport system ATP-binding protein/oligopeptide transport system ATP-binding protein n=1 Tax=Phycicoccus duodecadis TaxID=173053 RepID=A0A2N3YIB1_9MICO|nr:ABC transporter ATP-binding protein [Phycicoccus duodecadis]PKW26592.1 peptide/nickel transport system ATP-binding protein/oligopeptide transport system ATP-binding protein [Phycicoccus duodecadis]